jgi:hypothetical protein
MTTIKAFNTRRAVPTYFARRSSSHGAGSQAGREVGDVKKEGRANGWRSSD